MQKWAGELEDKYAVVGGTNSKLELITELLTPHNFPGLDPGVQTMAEAFVQRLCTPGGRDLGYPLCNPYAVDPIHASNRGRHHLCGVGTR